MAWVRFVCLLQLNCMSEVPVDIVLVWDLFEFFFCISFLKNDCSEQ